ncbi:MAG: 4-alpha-glucanotransferase, partial [Alphaproteobacteria bacterium]|nr:4-alpha-glucanotransferase [Alphaproteobacteria bacterium]
MEAIYVFDITHRLFDVGLKEDEFLQDIEVCCIKEGQKKKTVLCVKFEEEDRRKEGRHVYVKLKANIVDKLEPGYYELMLKTVCNEYRTSLAVAPEKCFSFDKKGKKKLYGFAVQLYSLKSKHNWGVGDFSDLAKLVDLTAKSGGDVIGLNPLNVLLHDYPESASPYASISRLFLNPIYIDVEKVPLFEKQDKDVKMVEQARASDTINYTLVYQAKIKALKKIFARLKKEKNSAYAKEFEAFKKADGGELNRLALFQAIQHERALCGGRLPLKDEKALSSSVGAGVEKFALSHQKEMEFFKFLQFEADRQLHCVEKKIKKTGMAIGLYRDLPVGVSKNSAEVWGDKYLYIQKSGAGAPPDIYFPTGQKWGLGAFNPMELKERGYKPFIKILRANMRYAGAIRIDHIMGLSRLFIIPDQGMSGTYIRYNAKDMMNILALESYLNQCAVVGECIGNVEAGYSESLLKRNIYLLGVLWSERKDDKGTMKQPDEYERQYFASVGTHDMPPLKAWWFGNEIAIMRKLGLYGEEEMRTAYLRRENERRLLLEALDNANVWPKDKKRLGNYLYGENYPEGIDEAVHTYMSKTKSEVFMLMLEDIFQSQKIQNLPGTDVEEYPNWRSKQIVDLEDMADSDVYQRHMAIVKKWR